MFLNVSGKKQSLQNKFFEYNIVSPNEVISEEVYPIVKLLSKSEFEKIRKINFDKVNSVLFKRKHALGDIVMLFPIINYLKGLGKKITIHTSTKYAVPGVDFITHGPRHDFSGFDLIVDLNWVVEKDHYEKKYYSINRVDIYKEYLNIAHIGNDWGVDFLQKDVDSGDAIIGVQLRGSTKGKTIDLEPLLDELEKRNIKFYVIDDIGQYKKEYKNAVVNPTDVVGLLNIFKRLKGVLAFDSGVLWLTHVTNTPAFVVTGPTHGDKLIKRHPNNKTTYYDTKKDHGCKLKLGCGESAKLCNGNFSCMKNVNYGNLNSEFFTWLERL